MIHLRVQWPNAGHALLADPSVQVLVDDVDLDASATARGKHDFEVPDGVAKLQLVVSFTAQLPLYTPAYLEPFKVFEASQIYRVESDILIAEISVRTNAQGSNAQGVVHPLIRTASAANAQSGLTLIDLRTEFLDVTAHWIANAPDREQRLFRHDADPDSDFVALASTGARPPLWFAHFPKGMDPPSTEVGVMTFFRPHAHYEYSTAYDLRHSNRGLQDLSRYLLAPKDHDPMEDDVGTITASERYPFSDTYYPLRVGWQQAVVRSGKQLVVLHPWPTSGLQFGDALTSKLPEVAGQILMFLLGTGRIGGVKESLEPGRIGFAGYSAGGPSAAQAMKANRSRTKELYLFDPYLIGPEKPYVIDWALRTADFRLRFTGANFWGDCAVMSRAVIAGVGEDFVSLRPPSPSFYASEELGGGHYWNYVMHATPAMRTHPEVQHQFAIFGGEELESDDDFNMVSNVTWLEKFLTESGF